MEDKQIKKKIIDEVNKIPKLTIDDIIEKDAPIKDTVGKKPFDKEKLIDDVNDIEFDIKGI